MRALDGLQGPVYVGTGCMFRRYALYGFNPPRAREYLGILGQSKTMAREVPVQTDEESDTQPLTAHPDLALPKRFGNSPMFVVSIPVAEFQGRPLADHVSVKNGRPPGALSIPWGPLDAPTVSEAIAVISCWYEDKTEWGNRVSWIYGSVTEDVVTGYRMDNRGWRSVYCITKRGAFRGTEPINLTDRLHQVKWTSLFLMPLTIILVNLVALVVVCARTVYSVIPQWSKLFGGAFFSFRVLAHMYLFAKGLMGRRGRIPTIIYVWAGLVSITIYLLWISISPPGGNSSVRGNVSI